MTCNLCLEWGVATHYCGPISRQYGVTLPVDRVCLSTIGETTTTFEVVGSRFLFASDLIQ